MPPKLKKLFREFFKLNSGLCIKLLKYLFRFFFGFETFGIIVYGSALYTFGMYQGAREKKKFVIYLKFLNHLKKFF